MSKLVKILGIAMVLTVILIVSVAGAAFAGNGNGPNPDPGTCPNPICPNLDCQYNSQSDGDCIPNPYHEPGPHGEQKGVVGD